MIDKNKIKSGEIRINLSAGTEEFVNSLEQAKVKLLEFSALNKQATDQPAAKYAHRLDVLKFVKTHLSTVDFSKLTSEQYEHVLDSLIETAHKLTAFTEA